MLDPVVVGSDLPIRISCLKNKILTVALNNHKIIKVIYTKNVTLDKETMCVNLSKLANVTVSTLQIHI
jgi:hypothetical protein